MYYSNKTFGHPTPLPTFPEKKKKKNWAVVQAGQSIYDSKTGKASA